MIEVTYIDHMGSDLSVVNAARVSFGKRSDWEFGDDKDYSAYTFGQEDGQIWLKLSDRDAKLIRYLAKEKHYSPFNHTYVTFHVAAPVFVARQLVKHEYMPWNEISRRYVDDEPEFYKPDVWRGRSEDKKQGSEGVVDFKVRGKGVGAEVSDFAYGDLHLYNSMIEQGVCPEQARMVLPQSMMTEWYWSGTMKAVHKMCSLRCKPDTQLETQIVANQIDEEMAKLFPVSWEALRAYED